MTHSETWGFCPDCQRWFYCEGGVGTDPVCPVCWGEPSAIDTDPGADAERRGAGRG